MIEFVTLVVAAVAIVWGVATLTRITLRHVEDDDATDPIPAEAVRRLCDRIDDERAANPDRQS